MISKVAGSVRGKRVALIAALSAVVAFSMVLSGASAVLTNPPGKSADAGTKGGSDSGSSGKSGTGGGGKEPGKEPGKGVDASGKKRGEPVKVKEPSKDVKKSPASGITGRVLDAKTGKPVAGAEIILGTGPVACPEPLPPPPVTLELKWGYLNGIKEGQSAEMVPWDGFVYVTEGAVKAREPLLFEKGGNYAHGGDDAVLPQTGPSTVEWRSSTTVHWDGIALLLVLPPPSKEGPEPFVVIYTKQWQAAIPAHALNTIHKVIDTDKLGRQLSIDTKPMPLPEPVRDMKERPGGPFKKPGCPDERPPMPVPPAPGTGMEKPRGGDAPAPPKPPMPPAPPMEPKNAGKAVTNSDGRYRIAARPGHYGLAVMARGYEPYHAPVNIPPATVMTVDVGLLPHEKRPVPPCEKDRECRERKEPGVEKEMPGEDGKEKERPHDDGKDLPVMPPKEPEKERGFGLLTVKLVWGYLEGAGDRAWKPSDFSGFVATTDGKARLVETVRFEERDFVFREGSPGTVQWHSMIGPHNDGVVVTFALPLEALGHGYIIIKVGHFLAIVHPDRLKGVEKTIDLDEAGRQLAVVGTAG